MTTVRSDDFFSRALYQTLRHIVWGIFVVWNRVSVKGLENIPYGACIWAPVHRSYIDTPAQAAVPVRLHFMAKDTVWKYDWMGRVLNTLGALPVSRGIANRAAVKMATNMLNTTTDPLVAYPEGGRRDGPRVHPLQPGAVYLAARAQVPIVPVGIGGTAAAMPRGARFLFPRRIRIVIGEPIDPLTPGANGRVPRAALTRACDELRERIQELYDEAQAYVGTPNVY